MSKSNLITVGALVAVIVGCDARDETQPLFGGTEQSAPAAASGTASGTVTGSVSTDGFSGEDTAGPQGNNPGAVPTPVLAEITTLDVSEPDSPRGHKIFAGNEIRGVAPGGEFDVEYSYFNLDFPCVGDALFENYPSQLLATTNTDMLGGFVWDPIVPGSETDVWNLHVGAILSGDEEHSILQEGIEVYPVNWGEIIVGSAIINKLVVTRIVQYAECSS